MPVSSLATATLRTAFLVVLGVLYLGVAAAPAQEERKDAMGAQLVEAVADGDAASVRELLDWLDQNRAGDTDSELVVAEA